MTDWINMKPCLVVCLGLAALLLIACPARRYNPADPASREYLETQLLRCILEHCADSSAAGVGDTGSGSPAFVFRLPDTGQTGCWNAGGGSVTCGTAPTGQDAEYANTPAAFTQTLTDGGTTITDASSGLIWHRCAQGQAGASCTGAPTMVTRAAADLYCAGLGTAGRAWRVPTYYELFPHTNFQNSGPALDATLFPNVGAGAAQFWTQTHPTTAAAGFDVTVNVQYGDTGLLDGSAANAFIRCVSGDAIPARTFTDNGDGTVTDSTNGLLWKQCVEGRSGAACATGSGTTMDWVSGLSTCEGLTFASRSDWRLPSVRELATLVDQTQAGAPMLDQTAFPNTDTGRYWTSTTSAAFTTFAFYGDFAAPGSMSQVGKGTGTHFARCVATN